MLTPTEELVKVFMFDKFIPSLHKILSTANPEKYRLWNGNTCRQSAVFGLKILKDLLPHFEWTAWDGDFSDIVQGQRVKYNHAWIHGIDKKNNRGLLVDLSRVDRERLFMEVTANKYPKDHPEYKNMRLIRKEKMNIDDCMKDTEYYTELPSTKVLEMIIEECTK